MKIHNINVNGLHLCFTSEGEAPVKFHLSRQGSEEGDATNQFTQWCRLVELQANGFDWADHHGNKYTGTNPAGLLRYQSHHQTETELEIIQEGAGLRVVSHFHFLSKLPAVRTWTEVTNIGEKSVLLEYVSSVSIPGASLGGKQSWDKKMRLHLADNTWYGECQWRSGNLQDFGLSRTGRDHPLKTGFSVNRVSISNQGSWSTLGHLPLGALENSEIGDTLFWQIEHNGSWHWEVSDISDELYVGISGPTYRESYWSKQLEKGDHFLSVPCTIGRVEGGLGEALTCLNEVRRLIRSPHPDMEGLPVMFNDYMNCLTADPTTEKLLPVIDAAAEVGCEYFVVDAGWFAALNESWWTSVGEWKESPDRFPGGFAQVMDAIRARGMIPGLWLEIEVVGITSPVAQKFPDTWFFQRQGQRVIDHGRYQLDFRNPEVRAHAHAIVDRVICDYGVGYIKNDYNINIGPGTDLDACSPGDGLLEHNRAFLKWISEVMIKHPGLVIENCSSGGLRMDYASLAQHSIQSVSDQTDYRLNGIIAAAAVSAVTPEQAAMWSYPLKDADEEQTIFNMVNAMLLRVHQSGRIHELSARSLSLVKEGISYYKSIRHLVRRGQPFWPIGLVRFGAPWATFGLHADDVSLLVVWRFEGEETLLEIPMPYLNGKNLEITPYPATENNFWSWSAETGRLKITLHRQNTARVLRLLTI